MKKLFFLAAAVLTSFSLMAQTTYSYVKGDGTLNTSDFQGGLTIKTDGNQTFESVDYTNYAVFSGTTSAPNYAPTKTVFYNAKSTATAIQIYAYSNESSNTKELYVCSFEEGASAFVVDTIKVTAKNQATFTKTYTNTTNRSFYLYANSKNIQIYKFDVTESGDALKQAGEVGYSLNFNKGRFCGAASTEIVYAFDGLKVCGISSNYSPNNNSELQIKSVYENSAYTSIAYVEFTASAACQLHIKDNNGKGYWVSQTLAAGADDDLITSKDAKVDITAGTWYIISSKGGAIKFNLIAFEAPDLTPALQASVSSVNVDVTAATPNPEAKVKFTGKNLTPGVYSLTVPAVTGLTVSPNNVTVGSDGMLNAEVTIQYANTADQAAASADLSLAINSLTATVTINYSAAHAKEYIKSSINIEQLILDNGKSYDIQTALTAAGWDYNNIDQLDSLNDTKTARNEPYLGLKIKKSAGYVAGWLKTASTLAVKFGNIGDPIKVSVTGASINDSKTYTKSELWSESDQMYKLDFNAYTEDVYVKIETTSTSTVVLKQMMLNEGIAAVTLPDVPLAIDNTEASEKIMKSFENGQLVIIKNGIKYNATGAIVK